MAGFSFGAAPSTSTAAPAPSGGLFGNTGTNTASSTGQGTGGLFGGSTSTAGTGGLFGAKPATSTGTGLFGSTPAATSTSTQPTGSLFGNTGQQNQQPQQPSQQQQQQQQSGGLFGLNASTSNTTQPASTGLTGSLFGSTMQQPSQQQQQQPQQNAQPSYAPNLGSSTLGILGTASQPQRGNLFASVSASNLPKKRTLQERLQKVAFGVMDPAQSELRSYVYYAAPAPNGQEHFWPGEQYISKSLFDEAQKHNPNRGALLPISLKGYDEMKKRVEIQLKHQVDQRTYIDSLQSQMTSAYREITQTLTLSQDKLQAQSSRIFSLLIKYVSDFAIMVRTIKGSDLTRQEEETWKLLKDVVKAYEAAGNGGRMEGRLAEFWAFILKLKQVVDGGYQSGGRFDWNAVSELELSNIFKEQGKALSALRNVAQDQKFDVETLEKGLSLVS